MLAVPEDPNGVAGNDQSHAIQSHTERTMEICEMNNTHRLID